MRIEGDTVVAGLAEVVQGIVMIPFLHLGHRRVQVGDRVVRVCLHGLQKDGVEFILSRPVLRGEQVELLKTEVPRTVPEDLLQFIGSRVGSDRVVNTIVGAAQVWVAVLKQDGIFILVDTLYPPFLGVKILERGVIIDDGQDFRLVRQV